MEIKINKTFAKLTDVHSLKDNQKIFLGVLSMIYVNVDMDTYLFFMNKDMRIMMDLDERWDPLQDWSINDPEKSWIYDCFEFQFHDYANVGLRPKVKLAHRKGWSTAGRGDYPVTLTSEKAIMMWWYLMGVFEHDVVSDFGWRPMSERTNNVSHKFKLHKDYISQLDERYETRDYKKK